MVYGEMKASSWTEYHGVVGGMCEFASFHPSPPVMDHLRCKMCFYRFSDFCAFIAIAV